MFPRLLDNQNLYLAADYTLFVIFLSYFTSNFYFSTRFVSFVLYKKTKQRETLKVEQDWSDISYEKVICLPMFTTVKKNRHSHSCSNSHSFASALNDLSSYWIFVVFYPCVFTLPILPRFCSFCLTIPPCSVGVGQYIMDLNHWVIWQCAMLLYSMYPFLSWKTTWQRKLSCGMQSVSNKTVTLLSYSISHH